MTKSKANQRKEKTRPFERDSLYYNEEQGFYVCPMGQRMEKSGEKKVETKSGYKQTYSCYTAKNCKGCPLRSQCSKGKYNRTVERNHKLEYHKQKARELLTSEIGGIRGKQMWNPHLHNSNTTGTSKDLP